MQKSKKSGLADPFATPHPDNALRRRWVGLVGCGKAKLSHAAPARELYCGSLTKLAIEWMDRNCERWYILSAKYGLVHPDRVIKPYNVKLDMYDEDEKQGWAGMVWDQLKAEGADNSTKMILAGSDYTSALSLASDTLEVCKGMKMGLRMQWLKRYPLLTDSLISYIKSGEKPHAKSVMKFSKMPIGCRSHFLDSGSFTLWTKAAEYDAKGRQGRPWAYYDTDEFWEYINNYAKFIKKHKVAIDLYSNVDVIPNGELTWRNQLWLEQHHGLHPVPVVHYPCDLKWLRHYIDKGYPMISLGGLVGSVKQEGCQDWIDKAFHIACDHPDNLPVVKIHGFGITSWKLLFRYPWWSVDSSSWTKVGAFGGILVPHKRKGEFVFTEPPYMIKVAHDSPDVKVKDKHMLTMSEGSREIVQDWLNHINIPLGKNDKAGFPEVYGVINRHCERKAANLYFFEKMRKALPKWPWPFDVGEKRTLVQFERSTREDILARQRAS